MEKIFILRSKKKEFKNSYAKITNNVVRLVSRKNQATHVEEKEANRMIKKFQSFFFEKIYHKKTEFVQLKLFADE